MSALLRASVAIVSAALIAGCGASGLQSGHEVNAADAQNGQSISAHVGDTVRITLNTTFWTFSGSSDASVLQPQGEAVASPAPRGSCFPGMGCGTTSAIYKAIKPGSATVSATRVTCGEAMRCVGAQGSYQVTVVVT